MTNFAYTVQTAIYKELTSNAPLMAAIVAVYDDVPQAVSSGDDTQFPYVTIGEDVHTDVSTDLELMENVSITVHSWSRYSGRSEVKTIQGLIYDALNRIDIINVSYKFININQVSSDTRLESDGFTRHGIQTFNLIIEEL